MLEWCRPKAVSEDVNVAVWPAGEERERGKVHHPLVRWVGSPKVMTTMFIVDTIEKEERCWKDLRCLMILPSA